jgi:predicted nucleotidyltransferase
MAKSSWAMIVMIVRRVLSASRPDRIILFGSAATGRMTKDSDIDLLVVDPAPRNTRDESVKIRRALGDVGYPVDVIVIATDRFQATKDIIGGIAYPAHKHGRILYEAAGRGDERAQPGSFRGLFCSGVAETKSARRSTTAPRLHQMKRSAVTLNSAASFACPLLMDRLPLRISETLPRVPNTGSRSLAVRPLDSIR